MTQASKNIQDLQNLIDQSKRIVFFGGAGMSTESGLPDFRGSDGLYKRTGGRSYEEMLSIGFFRNHPDAFWQFYKELLLCPNVTPNAGHYALARLERQGKLQAVITQNIDDLHHAAGSQTVYELHGTMRRNPCVACGKVYDLDTAVNQDGTPHCTCGGILRPDIVFYGEQLNTAVMDSAIQAVANCDLLIVGGTSLTVYPAAGLVEYRSTAKLALINHDITPYDRYADVVIRDSIAAVLDGAIGE